MNRHSFIYRTLGLFVRDVTGGVSPLRNNTDPLPQDHVELSPLKIEYDDIDSEGIRLTLRLVSALRDYVESRGMKFLLVEGIYRPIIDDHMRSTVTKKYGEVFDFDKVSEILKAHCDSNQIELLSLPELAKIRNITASDIMHAEDNLHLDARGIRFFAEAVVEKLNALGWINERTTGL
jgi:hypothetical protein